MKPVALAFVLLLGYAHIQGDLLDAVGRPMSLFRENGKPWIGYSLFALLLAAGVVLLWQLVRIRWFVDAVYLVGSTVMLAAIAMTPSVDTLHNSLAFLLLFCSYLYFATVYYRCNSRWLYAHLVLPVLLVFVTRLHSYGLWQKSMILYFLFAIVLEHHLLSDWLSNARQSGGGYTPQRRDTERRQKVYRLDD